MSKTRALETVSIASGNGMSRSSFRSSFASKDIPNLNETPTVRENMAIYGQDFQGPSQYLVNDYEYKIDA